MYQDRRLIADQRAMQIAGAYERYRKSEVIDISAGRDRRLGETFDQLGIKRPKIPSADYISKCREEIRIIEVKSRGSKGPIEALERELETLTQAQDHAWLYVIWNVTQRHPYELWLINNPRQLPWQALNQGESRSEPKFQLELRAIEEAGTQVDLRFVEGLPSKE